MYMKTILLTALFYLLAVGAIESLRFLKRHALRSSGLPKERKARRLAAPGQG